jgi:hypothetical protein
VLVVADGGADASGALELGVRVARSMGTELQVLPARQRKGGRRLAAQVDQLHRAGLDLTVIDQEGTPSEVVHLAAPAGLVVLGQGAWVQDGRLSDETLDLARGAGGPLLLVAAGEGDDGGGVHRLVERLDVARREGARDDASEPQVPVLADGQPSVDDARQIGP